MKYIKHPILVLLFLVLFARMNAQTEVLNDSGSWFTMTNKFKITDKFYAGTFLQYRRVDFISNPQFFFIGTSIGYSLSKNVSVGAGYTFMRIHADGGVNHRDISRDENRWYQKITLKSKIGKASVANRLVFEERFLDAIKIEDGREYIFDKKYSQRFRYRISVSFNLFKLKNNKYMLGKVTEEVRIRFKHGLTDPNFDQNNIYAYVGYQLFDNSKIWVGYGNDYFRINDTKYVSNKVLRINFSYDFDFRKNKP